MGKNGQSDGGMVKFFEEAITPGCVRGIKGLGEHPFIQDFYLAGGTALALQIGHRVSTDLDWFSTTCQLSEYERGHIRQILQTIGEMEVASEQDGLLFTRFLGTDVSFIYQHHPLLYPTVVYQGIQLASPVEIGIMKLAAINSRGTRRDFIDVYCLRDLVSLEQLFALAERKYQDRPSFLAVAARALAYFEDAEQQPMPKMFFPVKWKDVREYCQQAARQLARRLSGLGQ
jgi:predicted nucleotidyltransferase component of viral defense system